MVFQSFSVDDIYARIRLDNPWWAAGEVDEYFRRFRPRPYLELLYPLITAAKFRRAVVLMGPRRVGKTVMLNHAIQQLIDSGVASQRILYVSIDAPIYTKLPLEKILQLARAISGSTDDFQYCIFDEIQYLKDWEVHLKSLVDTYRNVKFIVSGSAAAALRLKSNESGAGRFTDFALPPLSFYEYLELSGASRKFNIQRSEDAEPGDYWLSGESMTDFNAEFAHYVNFGGYPELLAETVTRGNIERFVKSDIIDKVLLKDLPGLYGIQDIQELNSLFSALAYNSGKETSLESLSQGSGVDKNTIKKYITYLEASFLLRKFRRVDFNSKVFKRDNFFKIYLVNSSMRSALFGPMSSVDPAFGHLVETAIFSQWFHAEAMANTYYARWRDGEVDMVRLTPDGKPMWAVEVKWSNRPCQNLGEIAGLITYCDQNSINNALVTTIDVIDKKTLKGGLKIDFFPAALYCYSVGANIIKNKLSWSVDILDQRP